MIYKVEAEGDTLYIVATDKHQAEARLAEVMGGSIPSNLLTWTIIDELPDGKEAL
jgi:hypothetical protein